MLSERQFRLALRRGLVVIVGVALLAGGAAAAAYLLLPPRYVATQEFAVVAPLVSAGESGSEGSQVRRLSTSAELLVSESVLNRAIDGDYDVEDLRARLDVKTNSDSDLVTVSVAGGEMSEVVNTLSAVVSAARRAEVATERARIESALEGVNRDLAAAGSADGPIAVNLAGLQDAKADLTATLSSLTPSMQPVAEPSVRKAPLGPSLPITIIVGLIGGALLGASYVLLRTRFVPRVLHGEDVRVLGVPVVAGPESSLAQAARRLSIMSRSGSGEPRPLVLVMLGQQSEPLLEAIAGIAARGGQRLEMVKVGGSDSGGTDTSPDEPVVVHELDEDDVFSSGFEQLIQGTPDRWVIVSVSASDEVAVRVGTVVSPVVLVVREGDGARALERISHALEASRVEVAGAVVLGRRSARSGQTGSARLLVSGRS
jgi:hypothetical protein